MLFEDQVFQSKFDFDQKVRDEDANLNALVQEIERIQEMLYAAYVAKKTIYFQILEPYNHTYVLPFADVKESTWTRSQAEIKEILYRNQDVAHSSINKALASLSIEEPDDFDDYKGYLQLLYFCYMMNYFAFPKVNVLKRLKLENSNYHFSFDDGSDEGIYVTMILSNLVSNEDVLYHMIEKNTQMALLMNHISNQISYFNKMTSLKERDTWLASTLEKCHKHVEKAPEEPVLFAFYDYIHQYSMVAYCNDLLETLQQDDDWYDFDEIEYDPPISWMKLYVPLTKVDSFLESEECYQFCKQTRKKMEVRDRIKFMQSNAVLFLKLLLTYDRQWMEDEKKDEGIIITKHDGQDCVYALKLATMIQTYQEVVVKKKIGLFTGQKKQSLGSVLMYHKNEPQYAPLTLSVRFIMLAAHAQYLNITRDHYYTEFFKQHYVVEEIWNMKIIKESLRYRTIDDRISYLLQFLTYI